ncbi:MAG: TonB-dependent receptor, partial [Myxococcales bacterium]|nr:TonB-dependent receptor [Myxococcales bacterium]
RGQAVVRYSPRIAPPRLVTQTDEALRAIVVADHGFQGVVTLTGPIIKDKLFFALGVAPGGGLNSLVQSFYARVDKDRSGGFASCPYKNGDNDCTAGGNFIQTERFAEQRFPTWVVDVGYFGRVDWVISPKHMLTLSGGGGPRLHRTSYRLPNDEVPTTFGTNPFGTLGGASRVATGVVNDHFGTTLSNATQVGLSYNGRVAKDTIELDAAVSYFQSRYTEAWRLDHPELKDVPLTQESSTQGRNLYEFLDKDGALNSVRGVSDACNDPDIPGVLCPIRTWLSGGLGQYNEERSRRVEGLLSLSHFFNVARTAHQLKYGLALEHVERDSSSAYSGANDPDFYNNCPEGQIGGGEYCYDAAADRYTISTLTRVNNNRVVLVNSENPMQQQTLGYGRVRYEQDDLRAISTPIGAGVRAPTYDASLATQNYAVYLQDRVQLLTNLYLSAGVRWELQDMRDVLGNRALLIWDNVAPRVGLTYDWTDEGKSRLYASYGQFYRQLPLQLNSRVFGGLVTVRRSYRTTDCNGSVNIDGVDHPYTRGGQPTEYCTDVNRTTSGLTPGIVVPRLRGQFNHRFQLGYDQEVIEDLVVGVSWLHNGLGRAVEDVSTNGGLNYVIANPGERVSDEDIAARRAECDRLQQSYDALAPDDDGRSRVARELNQCNFAVDAFTRVGQIFDRPIRNYDAWTLRLTKRFAKRWLLYASYTYSRLIGNYDGSLDRDTGAVNLGASTQYDTPDLVRNSFGPLYDNRPHLIKLDGSYQFDLGDAGRLSLGTSLRFASGTPISLRADNSRYNGLFLIHVLPRGAGGSTPPLYQWNLLVGYAYPLSGALELELVARLVNVTNAKAVLRVDEIYSFASARPVAGAGLEDLKHAKIQSPGNPTQFYQQTIIPPQGNYGVETAFQRPLAAQFEVRLRF